MTDRFLGDVSAGDVEAPRGEDVRDEPVAASDVEHRPRRPRNDLDDRVDACAFSRLEILIAATPVARRLEVPVVSDAATGR